MRELYLKLSIFVLFAGPHIIANASSTCVNLFANGELASHVFTEQILKELDKEILTESEKIEYPSLNRMSSLEEIAYMKSLSEFWTFAERNFTAEEFSAVEKYTSYATETQWMNQALRGQKNAFGETIQLQSGQKHFATILDRAISKLPSLAGISFRGAAIPQSIIRQISTGSAWSEKGFMSTSQDRSIAEKFSFPQGANAPDPNYSTIFVIKGHSGRFIAPKWAVVRAEREVLYKPESQFIVTSIKVDKASQTAEIVMIEVFDGK